MLLTTNISKTNSTVLTLLIWIVLLYSQLRLSHGQQLSAEYLDVKLPFPSICQAPYYDGQDKIYLFGSCMLPQNQILVFSISSETIQTLDTLLPGRALLGSVQSDNFGNLFFFGGGPNSNQVFKFDSSSNSSSHVATLPYDVAYHTSFKRNESSNIVYIFGGYSQAYELLAFDMETATATRVADIPLATYSPTSVRVGNKVYTFAYAGQQQVLELDLNSFQMVRVGDPILPVFPWHPTSVGNGNLIYIIGGYHPQVGWPTEGIIQFDAETFQSSFLPVRNLPVDNVTSLESAPVSVFVGGKNRIYCFGGRTTNGTGGVVTSYDEIFYVDLTPGT